jgi:hypothetical protein
MHAMRSEVLRNFRFAGHSLGDEIDLETSARVGKVRFSGSWQVLSCKDASKHQACLSLGGCANWHFMCSYNKFNSFDGSHYQVGRGGIKTCF